MLIKQVSKTQNPGSHLLEWWSSQYTFMDMSKGTSIYYDDTTNPYKVIGQQFNQSGISVWGSVSSSGMIGPFFFEGTLDGDKYLQSQLLIRFCQFQNEDLIWTIATTTRCISHFVSAVRIFLDESLPAGWIGRRGKVGWPPRSPDLTLIDFFLEEFWKILFTTINQHWEKCKRRYKTYSIRKDQFEYWLNCVKKVYRNNISIYTLMPLLPRRK